MTTLPTRPTILIADDHALVRVGIQTLLRQIETFHVVAEAEDGREALTMIERLTPDVVLMDVGMPGLSGLEVAQILQERHVPSRVIMLSANEERETVLAALQVGSRGYLVKSVLLTELEIALNAVYRGDCYISPQVAHHVIGAAPEPSSFPTPTPKPPQDKTLIDGLTPRQCDVLVAVVNGFSTKEVARQLGISPKTVEFHRNQISERLGGRDAASWVRVAMKAGLVKSA